MDTAAARPRLLIARVLFRIAIVNGLMLWGLLWAADTAAWPEAYWCIGLLFGGLILSVLILSRINPDVLVARLRLGKGTKRWDYLMLAILVLGTAALIHAAGFGVRLDWERLPPWLEAIGGFAILAGVAGITWSQAVNRHFETGVRIQADRGHAVVDTGPYAVVRHPGYVAGALILIGMALMLGSPHSLIPAALVIASLMVRTVLEERTLRVELPGYAEYAARVRRRWVPGLW